MKKNIIIIIMTTFLVLFILITFMFLGIFPNPFLDRKDLVCVRDDTNITINQKVESIMIFSFDKKAKVKSYIEKKVYTHDTKKANEEFYNNIENKDGLIIEKTDNSVTVSINQIIEKDKGFYGTTRKKLKKFYENEFNYECE